MLTITKAGKDQIRIVRELAYKIWPDTFKDILLPEQITYMLQMMYDDAVLLKQVEEQGVVFLLAAVDGVFGGFAGYELHYKGKPVSKLHKIYILPEMQGKSIGRALMDAVVDRYFPVIDALETELEAIEERIFTRGAARTNIQQLYALKRQVTDVRHAVTPLMEAATKLYGNRCPAVCAGNQDYFRDVSDHLQRINASLDALRDTIGTAIQVNLSMVTIEESEVNKRLAAWAGIFAVATAFAGIWDMNFKVMPELEWQYGYPTALGLIAITCGILYRRFRRAGWL